MIITFFDHPFNASTADILTDIHNESASVTYDSSVGVCLWVIVATHHSVPGNHHLCSAKSTMSYLCIHIVDKYIDDVAFTG